MRRKLLSLIMALCMVMTLLPVSALAADGNWIDSANTSWYDDGSAAEFTIDSAEELAGLAKLVNEGKSFSGKTIKLDADISLGGKEWTPIGMSKKSFNGIFDGNEKTISNLVINSPAQSDVGLFGFTQSGEVKNFTLNNAKVTGYLDVGAVAGTPYTSKYSNIDVTGLIQVEGFSYVGGAFGKNAYANITDVDVTGDEGSYVKADSVENGIAYRTYLGGLAGFMGEGNITVSGCNVKIDVTGSTCDVGGILGILHYGNTLTDCTYEGSLTLTNPEGESGNEFGALVGVIQNYIDSNTPTTSTITNCIASVSVATEGVKDVTDTITAHGGFYNDIVSSGNNNVTVTVSATVNGKEVSADNNVAKIGDTGYKTLAAAIAAANAATGTDSVTVTITKSGEYDPFTITRANVTVEAADGVEATFNVSASKTGNINGESVTLKGLNFVSTDGTTIFSSGNCDKLTLDGCTFTGNGTGTALYIHKPNITITGCKFENFERGYYTCGDNHAAGAMTFTNNEFANVRVPIDGYWGKAATDDTNITITGNTIIPGSWGTSYLQLWDYTQYKKWEGNTDADRQGSAIKATIEDNTYKGDVVIYATHFNWFYNSTLTVDEASEALLKYRVLVEMDGAASATVTNADGSAITAFNETTASQTRNGKTFIYSISEGDYIFNIKPTGSTGDGLVTESVTVKPTTVDPSGNTTNKVTVDAGEVYVAQVGDAKYTTLAEAIQAAKNGGTVELLSNISIDTWKQVWDVENMTIKGNNHTITIGAVESGVNGNYLFYGAEGLNVSDLTINFTTNGSGFSMVSGKLENVKMYGGDDSNYAVFVGTSDGPDATVEVSHCLFDGFKGAAVYSQPAGDGKSTSDITVNGTTISDCGMAMCSYAQNTVFTNNTVIGGSEVSFAGAAEGADRDNTYTITGNTFQDAGKIWFYGADLADVTFTKNQVLGNTTVSTDQANGDTKLNVSENYWGGNAPSGSQLSGTNVTGSDVYYVRPTMKDEDLNTYVPPVIDGGGSSVSGDYLITVDRTTGGKVTVNPGRADKGDTVTITVKPNDGYVLDELTVTAKDGGSVKLTWKDDSKYTFTMPGSQVTVEATFVKDGGQTTNDLPFTDVTTSDWYYDAVEYVYENDLMNGTSANTFSPFVTTSRAMMLTILARYDGVDTSTGSTWYEAGAVWAIAEGVSDGTNLEANLTREQLVTMLWRYAGSPVVEGDLADYPDSASVSDWAVNAMIWAVENGVITGNGAGALNPQGTATRAEVATILMRFIEN